MRPVNLLPASHRARKSGGQKNSSYAVLGVLAVLLGMVAMFVLTGNKATQHESDLARLQAETAAAQQKAAANASYGNFSQIKATRLAAVTTLAQQRFDWERMSREIAHVLPAGVSLTSLEATLGGPAGAGQTSGTASTEAAPQPTLKLTGCAPDHPVVADTLVRLRRLHRVDEVTLNESANTDEGAGGGGGSGGSGAAACDGKEKYGFNALVTFELMEPETTSDKVPARLGGGS